MGFLMYPSRFGGGGAAWTYEDNFDTYANVTEGDAAWPTTNNNYNRVNPVTDKIDWNPRYNADRNNIYHDLDDDGIPVLSSTTWLWRLHLNMTGVQGASDLAMFGMSSIEAFWDRSTVQDWVGVMFTNQGGDYFGVQQADAAGIPLVAQAGKPQHTWIVQNYYFEQKRLSATSFQVEVYTNPNFSSGSIGSDTETITSTIRDMRYITSRSIDDGSIQGTLYEGTIDDVQINDGVTTPP